MAKLMIVYDPEDKISCLPAATAKDWGIKEATLAIPDDLEGKDIYGIARKLAELLLEQL